MKLLINIALVAGTFLIITIVATTFNWTPFLYFITCTLAGGLLGYITGKAGYEV
jgi:hypothetical protein